jgi:hypothetical protein
VAEREWDIRIVWNVKHQRWWWNAWREASATELWGFADSQEEALQALMEAMRAAGYPDQPEPPPEPQQC